MEVQDQLETLEWTTKTLVENTAQNIKEIQVELNYYPSCKRTLVHIGIRVGERDSSVVGHSGPPL